MDFLCKPLRQTQIFRFRGRLERDSIGRCVQNGSRLGDLVTLRECAKVLGLVDLDQFR